MGNSDVDRSSMKSKEPKEPETPIPQNFQEQASAGADWSGFQAYSPMPPHGYLASTGHPYMWPVPQFIPPYGTPPPPYVAMYPYPHPTMAPGSYPFSSFAMHSPNGNAEAFIPFILVNANISVETDGRLPEGKKKLPIKRSRGSLGSSNMVTTKNNETYKAATPSANDVYSKSDESASGDSSERSDENSQNSGSGVNSAEPSQNASATHTSQNGGPNPTLSACLVSGVPGPLRNLNSGMDYWGGTPTTCIPAMRSTVPATPANGTRDNVQSQLWIQDERELKKQKRKQANRESARRSRLRKQAECDELAQRSEALKEENALLRAEVARLRSSYVQLLAQNASLKERLGEEADPRCILDLDGL